MKRFHEILQQILVLAIPFSGLFGNVNEKKIGPYLKCHLNQHAHHSLNKHENRLIALKIYAKNPEILRTKGFDIRTIHGPFATARVYLSRIHELASCQDVQYIQEASECRFQLDKSMPDIGMDQVHAGVNGHGYTGKNVIIGIVDTGIDWTHPDFIDEEGKTRILAIWDQTQDDNSGYRHIYSKTEIQAALDQHDFSQAGGKDIFGHGTCVAGIAAGNGRGTGNGQSAGKYIGAAPDAYLVIVKTSDNITVTDVQVEEGVNYIFETAQSYGMPCVVNLSLGRQSGSHDGRSLYELGLDEYLFNFPGRAIVVAAGNNGGEKIHVKHEFNPFIQDTCKVEIMVSDNATSFQDQISLEGWIHYFSPAVISVVTPQGVTIGPVDPGAVCSWPDFGSTIVYIDNGSAGRYFQNGDKQILIQLSDGAQGNEIQNGKWILKFYDASDRLDLWMVNRTLSAEILSEVDQTTLMNEPAYASSLIAVGSYITRDDWPSLWKTPWGPGNLTIGELSTSSSPGPSRPNAMGNQSPNKPELIAPGEYIVSALSRWISVWPGNAYVAADSVHLAVSGTSFSAPHVSGVIACMFESDPTLTASKIKNYLMFSAKKDAFTGNEFWNPQRGCGKVNAVDAVLKTSIQHPEADIQPNQSDLISNYPNPFNSKTIIRIRLDGKQLIAKQHPRLEIRDIRGKQVQSFEIPVTRDGSIEIPWNGNDKNHIEMPSGVYFAHLFYTHKIITQKLILIR